MIPEGWKSYKLGEIADIIGGGTPSTAVKEYWDGPIPWLTPKDLTNYPYNHIKNGERAITELGLKNSSARLLPKGTVLMTSRAPIGYLALADNQLCTNQGFKSFIPDETKVNNVFLYYLLYNYVEQIKSLGTGTTFAEVSGSTLKGIEFVFPGNISEQSQIASILSSLDDKIELNLQMNKTLEAIAQVIFKEWFIDFRFPGFDGELLDGLPKGWTKGKLGDHLDTVLGGTPSKTNKSFWENGEVPWINSGKVNEFRITKPTEYITKEAVNNSNTKLLPRGTTLIAITGATLGQVSRLEIDACANQSVVGILENNTIRSEYIYLWTKHNIKNIVKGQTGGAQQHINKNDINESVFLVPDQDVCVAFQSKIKPIFSKISENCFQNETLTNIRDSLLPKLMTGKIRVA